MPFISVKEGIITEVDNMFLELSCYDRGAFIGMPLGYVWKNILCINVEPGFMEGYQEGYLLTGSLEAIHINIKTEVDKESNSIIYTFYEMKEYICEKRRIEKQNEIIKQQKEQLEIIIDNISDGICVVDKYGNVMKVNSTFQNFLMNHHCPNVTLKKVEDAAGCKMHFYDEDGKLLAPEELPMYRVLKGERVEKQRVIFKGDHKEGIIEITVNPVFDKKGELLYGIILGHDITHMMEKRRLIDEQKENLEAVIENFDDAIIN